MNEKDQVMDELLNLRKQILELEKENQLYKETEKSGKVGGWKFDPVTLKQTWTDEVFRILEIDLDHGAPEVPQGLEFIDPQFRSMAEDAVQQAMVNGEPYNQEWIVTTHKGNKKWVNAVCNPKMENGKVVAISGSFQDITSIKTVEEQLRSLNQQLAANEQQLKAANQQLNANEQQLKASNQQLEASEKQLKGINKKIKESEKQFRQLFENMTQGFALHEMIYDENNNPIDYRFLLLNKSFEKLTGIVASDYIGKTIKQLLPDIDQIWIDNYGKVAHTSKPLQFEHYSKEFDRYYNVTAYSPKKGFFATVFTDTTHDRLLRKQLLEAKEKAEESEEKVRQIFENSTIVHYSHDLDHVVNYVSPQVENILGYTPEEMKVKWTTLTSDNPINQAALTYTSRAIETGKKQPAYEIEFVHKNGKKVLVEVHEAPVVRDGKTIFIVGSYADITERKQVNDALQKNKNLLNETGQMAKVGGWEIDLFGNTLAWTEETFRIHELSTEIQPDVAGAINFYHPEDQDMVAAAVQKTIQSGLPFDFQARMITSGGNHIWVRASGKAVFHKEKMTGIIGSIQDISELKQTEIELKTAKEKAEESKANITAIIEGTNNSIWAFNRNYQVIYINKEMQQEFLNTFGVLLKPGMSLIEALPESLQPLWLPRYNRVLDNERFDTEDAVPTDKGTIYIHVSFNPIVKDGQVIGGSCFGSNVTSRKLAEIELTEAKEKAEESDRLKSAFLANMSHEIRTPMNGILGFTKLLYNPNLTGEEQQKFVDIIQRSGVRMLSTVNDIIDISRIESGQVELSVSEVNINDQLKDLHSFFKHEANNKGIQLILRNEVLEEEDRCITDIDKFNSIITNLIKNAIKFTDQGVIELGYKVKNENGKTKFEFYVKDSGIGIPKDRQKAIFDRFVQADIEDSKANQGSGLGLAISKAYAEMLGGRIWVVSEVGLGSTFYFTIDHNSGSESKSITKNDRQETKEDNVSGMLNILVVEDDEFSQDLISILVEKIAKKIINVRSGIEAVEVCRSNPYIDLILMDIRLPDMNGYEAIRQIRQFNKDIVIIAQTAFALAGDKEKAIKNGCDDYISKPIDKEDLLNKIELSLKNK